MLEDLIRGSSLRKRIKVQGKAKITKIGKREVWGKGCEDWCCENDGELKVSSC